MKAAKSIGDPALERAARLEQYSARALDFAEFVATLERFAASSLGLRALCELAPRKYEEAKAALVRTREMLVSFKAGDQPSFGGVSDPLPVFAHAHRAGRPLDEDGLVLLRAFLDATTRLRPWLTERERGMPALAALARTIPDFAPLVARLDLALDEQGRVRDQASPSLARIRKEETQIAADIEKKLRAYVARAEIKAVLSDPNPARRGGRSVLAVKAKSAGRVHGLVHDRSQSGETVFIEPREVVVLGNRHAELVADERREVERVLLELSREVLAQEVGIARAAEALAELELATIAARFARESGARVPLLPGEPGAASGMLLRSARHPLLVEEQRLGRLAEVVPIDLRLGGDFDVLIVTGPNTGGKTLALKSAGLFALLTRCGLPFPCAEGSTAPLYDGIVADIGDEQEIKQSLSTFSSHMQRIKAGLERATEGTLVLLDELGGGTDPDEGAALSEAILERFLERKAHTIVSTHIGKLKEFAFRHPRAENACVEFDVQTLAPCYHLIVGTPGESGALVIARRLGLDSSLVERAQERLVRRDADTRALMVDMAKARTATEKVRGEAEARLEDAARTQRDAEVEREALRKKGELLEAEAQKGIEDRVREAVRRIAGLRALFEQVAPAQRAALQAQLAELEGELTGSALSERRLKFLTSLKKGTFVFLPRYRKRVAIQKVDRAAREVTVQLGTMRMQVSFDELTSYEGL